MMVEYAACYGGPPRPDDPWPLFFMLANHTGRFDDRLRLQLLDSVSDAIGRMFGDDELTARLARDRLLRSAYPMKRKGPPIIIQQSGDYDSGGDGAA